MSPASPGSLVAALRDTRAGMDRVGRRLLAAKAVALKLGYSAEWFARKRPGLERLGFPRPVLGCGKRWDPAAIDAWLDLQRIAAADHPGAPPAPSASAAVGEAHDAGADEIDRLIAARAERVVRAHWKGGDC